MVKESEETERKRREWAAQQTPKLITAKDAFLMLGLSRTVSIHRIARDHGIASLTHPLWGTSRFFYEADMRAVAQQRQAAYAAKRAGSNYRLGGVELNKPPEKGWTMADMVKRWGDDSPQGVCDRAPSIFKLPFDHAYILLRVLAKAITIDEGERGMRHDLQAFKQAARRQVPSDLSKRLALERHIGTYYEIPAFTRLDPVIAVAVLYELMESSPRTKRT